VVLYPAINFLQFDLNYNTKKTSRKFYVVIINHFSTNAKS
jgi:hypothetical protein